jgi:hypothetical protein
MVLKTAIEFGTFMQGANIVPEPTDSGNTKPGVVGGAAEKTFAMRR